MADSSDPFVLHFEEVDEEESYSETLDPAPYWSSASDFDPVTNPTLDPDIFATFFPCNRSSRRRNPLHLAQAVESDDYPRSLLSDYTDVVRPISRDNYDWVFPHRRLRNVRTVDLVRENLDSDDFRTVSPSNDSSRRRNPLHPAQVVEYEDYSGSLSDHMNVVHPSSVDHYDWVFPHQRLRNPSGTMDVLRGNLDSPTARIVEMTEEILSGYDELGLGAGLDSGFENQEGGGGGNREVVPDWGGDDFFIGRRRSAPESNEFSRACPIGEDGRRVIEFESDSDSDEQIVAIGENSDDSGEICDGAAEDVDLPLCWDCLRIEEDRRDPIEDFEWEEIYDQLEERELHSMMSVADETSENIIRELEHNGVGQEEDMARNIEWEVLLTVNNLGREDPESYSIDDQEGFFYTSEYDEVLFAQFADHDSSLKGSPPAAKSVVENLPTVVLTKEDVANNMTHCAVCKDEIFIEEKAKRLPCSHHYHEECIVPWLRIRNTCPLCRYELPTDDPEYENWKARRRTRDTEEESGVRYAFEILPEA